jgi:hypothetical protein
MRRTYAEKIRRRIMVMYRRFFVNRNSTTGASRTFARSEASKRYVGLRAGLSHPGVFQRSC